MAEGTKEVLVTGIRFSDKESGQEMMGNLAVTKEGVSFAVFPFIGESFPGQGICSLRWSQAGERAGTRWRKR